MKRPHLMDPAFRYYSAADTDVSRTFARVRREMKAAEAAKAKPAGNVKALPPKKEKGRG